MTSAPSATSHSMIVPSSIVSPSLGIGTSVAIVHLHSLDIEQAAVCGAQQSVGDIDEQRPVGADSDHDARAIYQDALALAVVGEYAWADQIDCCQVADPFDARDAHGIEGPRHDRGAHEPAAITEPHNHSARFEPLERAQSPGDAGETR